MLGSSVHIVEDDRRKVSNESILTLTAHAESRDPHNEGGARACVRDLHARSTAYKVGRRNPTALKMGIRA